ncbi:SMC-Scp complex subunit ScpB [Rhodopirellula sallentina]|uniref:Transcriptional regulator n=1 Tax=Rhodopirellula sallentina SM41 TaxID=1263870 RepID=M5U1N7_9BACT|nr:SMC-Scp complex subunit ScpB [Rhodopirellula sallentina]EMI55350.1 transcriptional regulator [Rhodopirellula sallentina SM41]
MSNDPNPNNENLDEDTSPNSVNEEADADTPAPTDSAKPPHELTEPNSNEDRQSQEDDAARAPQDDADEDGDEEEEHDDAEVDFEDDEDAFSLEELGAAYKHIVAKSDSEEGGDAIQTGEVLQREQLIAAQAVDQSDEPSEPDDESEDVADDATTTEEEPETAATPEAIIEAALFVGHPNGNGITAARLASIMRGMTPEEVVEIIDALNESYRTHRQGIRIAQDDSGYRLVVAPEVESIRHVFTGKVRETKLSQGAIEVLSLVAYQPGITAAECTDKRGRDSGSLLNQMVRRRLVEMRREPETPVPDDSAANAPEENKSDAAPGNPEDDEFTLESSPAPRKPKKKSKPKMVSRFYPAERLLVLLGLESLEDLPQVEEVHLE